MREMKDSGIEWIGEIPVGWEIIRMKNAIFSREAGAWGDEKVGNENDVICLRIADFDYQRLRFKEKNELTIRNYKPEVINKLLLKKGDILIEKSGGGEKTPVGRAVIFDKDYNALFANFLERLRTKNTVDTYYFLYILTAFYQNKHMVIYIKQTTGIQNLDITSMINFEYLPFPPLKEQHRISTYLDTKCEKIDSIIARQQEVIEKLKAYKLSVITEAVTKGLHPDVRMKDSGIEWIGDVPEHWEIATISRVANMYNGDRSSNYPSGTDIVDEGVIFVTSNNLGSIKLDTDISTNKFITKEKYDSLRGAKLQKNDIIFCLRGSVGKCSINFKFESGTIASSLVCIRPMLINPDYLNFTLHTPMIVEQAKLGAIGIGSQNLAAEDVGKVIIAIPTKNEQQQIADYLDKKCSAIDSAIAKKQAIIEKLTAYKKSLIYEGVTGKREV